MCHVGCRRDSRAKKRVTQHRLSR